MKDSAVVKMLKTGRGVFTTQDLALLWRITEKNYLKTKIYRLIKNGNLRRIRGGVYVIGENYNSWEAANKIIAPSYVSLSSVLAQAGIIFQYDSAVYSIASTPRTVVADGQKYVYRRIAVDIFFLRLGIETVDNVDVATPERAILDTLYLEKDFYADNPDKINWERCFELAPYYENKKLIQRLKKIYGDYIGSKKA